jgi:hypothetical protein
MPRSPRLGEVCTVPEDARFAALIGEHTAEQLSGPGTPAWRKAFQAEDVALGAALAFQYLRDELHLAGSVMPKEVSLDDIQGLFAVSANIQASEAQIHAA